MSEPRFNIAAVERDTGLSKDVLRIWERRYGFPVPERDGNGERAYSADQVDRLRLIKRLMDQGHRPGKLMALSDEGLAGLAPRHPRPRAGAGEITVEPLDDLIEAIRRHDGIAYQQGMQHRLARQGLQHFVLDTVAPLTRQIGEGWEVGSLEVFEEHLFTELTKRLLRQAIAGLPAGGGPRILLTSVPEEQHMLGLLMVETLLALEGAECIPLGTQMPLLEIARAVEAHQAEIVALSFSAAFPQRQVAGLLQHLRQILPPQVALWAGGLGIRRQAALPGVELLATLEEALSALAAWRAARA